MATVLALDVIILVVLEGRVSGKYGGYTTLSSLLNNCQCYDDKDLPGDGCKLRPSLLRFHSAWWSVQQSRRFNNFFPPVSSAAPWIFPCHLLFTKLSFCHNAWLCLTVTVTCDDLSALHRVPHSLPLPSYCLFVQFLVGAPPLPLHVFKIQNGRPPISLHMSYTLKRKNVSTTTSSS